MLFLVPCFAMLSTAFAVLLWWWLAGRRTEHMDAEKRRAPQPAGAQSAAVPTRVRLKGLAKRPELNGQLGYAERFDEASQRLSVRLDGSKQILGIKLCNLDLLSDTGV